jgi:hypothetical protein
MSKVIHIHCSAVKYASAFREIIGYYHIIGIILFSIGSFQFSFNTAMNEYFLCTIIKYSCVVIIMYNAIQSGIFSLPCILRSIYEFPLSLKVRRRVTDLICSLK